MKDVASLHFEFQLLMALKHFKIAQTAGSLQDFQDAKQATLNVPCQAANAEPRRSK